MKSFTIMSLIKNFTSTRRAVTAIEYGLIAALIAVVIIGGVTSLGKGVENTFTHVSGEL